MSKATEFTEKVSRFWVVVHNSYDFAGHVYDSYPTKKEAELAVVKVNKIAKTTGDRAYVYTEDEYKDFMRKKK